MSCDLSIVIVNYNVRHFLQQTLESVRRASQNLMTEVWVVDNNSIDDSVEMVKRDFPEVKIIANKDNPGFSKANNQAIARSDSKYILLLNPDTILQEDTLDSCFHFMESHSDAGAVGAKMLDGSGQFLPESKRGFPTPWVSFCKASGLSVLFPRSKTFNRYHLGYLDKDQTHEIDVLCGAFMFMRSSMLDEVGVLDEAFFMYGEDIDLSFRIKNAGHKIYYYPETQLIHFKGESTKKSTVNYVKVFYQAMIIFAKKHFSGRGAGFLVILLNLAIIARASVSLLRRAAQSILPQLIDFALIFTGMYLIKEWWEVYQFGDSQYFKPQVLYFLALISAVYVGSLWLHGVYRKQFKVGQILRSVTSAVLLLLAAYALINAEYRFSRTLVLLSSVCALFVIFMIRFIHQYAKNGNFDIGRKANKRIIIIGGRAEAQNVETLLEKSLTVHQVVARIAPEDSYDAEFHSSKWDKLQQIAILEKANEFIFCTKDLEWQHVIAMMNTMGPDIEYKMVGDDKMSILGSKSKNTSGELYTVQFQFNLSRWQEKWKKRTLDILVSLSLIVTFFIFLWAQANKKTYFGRLFQVLIGNKTMVGYRPKDERIMELPVIKTSLLDAIPNGISDEKLIHRANLIYAKDYSVWKDLEVIARKITKIG